MAPRTSGPLLRLLTVVVCASLAGACTTVRITATTRSSIEQRLLTHALARAAAQIDLAPLAGRRVKLDVFALTADQGFAREFLRARLETRGVRIVRAGEADVTLQVFAAALAVDSAETLLGLPAMQAPTLGIPIPELALFKWERSRGHVEAHSYLYDPDGRLVGQGRDVLGETKYHRFTVLFFVNFTVTDVDDPPMPDD